MSHSRNTSRRPIATLAILASALLLAGLLSVFPTTSAAFDAQAATTAHSAAALATTAQAGPSQTLATPIAATKKKNKKKKKKRTYTVKPSKEKNDTARIRQIMKRIEKAGGGKIVFKKGVYQFANTVYLPSNVTVKLNKGAILRKTTKGALKGKPSASMFQTLRESRYNKKKVYGAYEGERNITFKGPGTIDLAGVKGAHGILAAHTRKLTISGVKFTNMNGGHFIEANSSVDTKITKNSFTNAKDTSGEKEAINVDSADPKTGGLTVAWTKGDQTPNKRLTISNNTFTNLRVAIGTHKYSWNSTTGFQYHLQVRVANNKITGTSSDAIRALAWKDAVITGNTIRNAKGSGIWLAGTVNARVANNTVGGIGETAITFRDKNNNDAGGSYPQVTTTISCALINELRSNTSEDDWAGASLNVSPWWVDLKSRANSWSVSAVQC